MADFESIIKTHCGEDGSIPADAIGKLAKAISTTVGNEFVDKNRYKAKLDEIDELTGKLQTAEDSVTTAEKWKTKYEGVKADFNAFKEEQVKKDTRAAKETAYRALLKEAGISERRIDTVLRVSNVDGVELTDKGTIKGADKLMESIKAEWADFVTTTTVYGAKTPQPPANNGSGTMTRDEIFKIRDSSDRQKAIAENMNLFRKE